MPTFRLSWLFALPVLFGAIAGCGTSDSARPTRVVLITLDTLRYDAYAGEGGAERMPNLHALAATGWDFERFYASTSTTQPTHASLMTGLQPWSHGVTRNGLTLSEDRTTIAEQFKVHGFETRAVVASFPLHARFGFAQGFDTYVDDFDVPYVSVWEGETTEQGKFFSLAESVTRSAIAALDEAKSDHQFHWFHYFDPHDPYGDTARAATGEEPIAIPTLLNLAGKADPRLEQWLSEARARYDEDVAALDRSLGLLFARLARDEDRYDTHIVITADHGESFGERLSIGHGKRVTKEQVHVPLIIASPQAAPSKRRDLATSIDIPRTLLALANLAPDPFEGRDLQINRPDGTIFGMRRAFSKPKPEVLANGRRRDLPLTWFFSVHGDVLHGGNADIVLEEDDLDREVTGERADALRAVFAGYGRLLANEGDAEESLDDEAREALSALGYTD